MNLRSRASLLESLLAPALWLPLSLVAACASTGPKAVEAPVVEGPLLPKGVFFGAPPYKHKTLGVVRSTREYPTLNIEMTPALEEAFCRKAFADAVRELLKTAKANGADGVADVHSVVFLADGRRETFDRPECTDDGAEGDVLVQGVAIQWVRTAKGNASSPVPASSP
jgi:hypothetical protein